MIPLSLRDVVALTGGTLSVDIDVESGGDVSSTAHLERLVVDGVVSTDSRECGPGSLYVARVGEHADGHDFVAAAAAAGAVAALTEHPVVGLPSVVTGDVQSAFGRLARGVLDRARTLAGTRVVAVTGSSGKTTTKDLLAQVLSSAGETVAPANSLNGEVGVPLTVCRLTGSTSYLVAEMGARGVGHLSYLTTIAPPNVSIVLNVGSAHLGEFGSRDAVAQAKGELVEALRPDGLAVLNADDARVAAMRHRTTARVVTVGLGADADVRATDVVLDGLGRASFLVHGLGGPGSGPHAVALGVSGAHHVGNALAAIVAAVEVGVEPEQAVKAASAAGPTSRWRMEVHERQDGVTVVNDAYNANPESMAAGLRALRAIATAGASDAPPRRSWAVLGQMLELGEESEQAHRDIGELTSALELDRVVVVGEGARAIAQGADPEATSVVDDVDAAYALLTRDLAPGDVVLLKSSRDAGLRWLGDRLAGIAVAS